VLGEVPGRAQPRRQAAEQNERRHETLELLSTAEEALAAIRRRLIAAS